MWKSFWKGKTVDYNQTRSYKTEISLSRWPCQVENGVNYPNHELIFTDVNPSGIDLVVR